MFFRPMKDRRRRPTKSFRSAARERRLVRMPRVVERLEDRAMLAAASLVPPNLGVLLVDPSASAAANLAGNANVNVTHGDFAIDSTSSTSAALSGNGHITASDIYLAGHVASNVNSHLTGTVDFSWTRETDPLSGLSQPSLPGTTSTIATINNRSMTLSPGAYIDALTITGNSNVTLLPGLYYFEHGLTVSGNADLTGTGVTLYNAAGAINLAGNAILTISAPTTGTYAGIALFQNRADSNAIVANSNATLKLTGELYSPDATLNLSGNAVATITGNGSAIAGAAIIRDLTMSGNGYLAVTANVRTSVDVTITKTDSGGGSSSATIPAGQFASYFPTPALTYTDFTGKLTVSGSTIYGAAEGPQSESFQNGEIFSVGTNGQNAKTLVTFGGANGSDPNGYLVLVGSTLYGETQYGGPNSIGLEYGYGEIFSVNTDGSNFKILHSFDGTDGSDPYAGGLTLVGSKLYGTTANGGANNTGVLFSINLDGSDYTVLDSFSYNVQLPMGSLVASGSTLYGETQYGGSGKEGTIFSVKTDGSDLTTIYTFPNGPLSYSNGIPGGTLAISGSTLYGTTIDGSGYVFSVNTDGTGFKVLHTFNSTNGYGIDPQDLTISGTTIYGDANEGGSNNDGEIFSLSTSGTDFQVLHSFDGSDGEVPVGGVTIAGSTLFGSTLISTEGPGTIYSLGLGFVTSGDTVTYQITVSNSGPGTATSLKISDPLTTTPGLTSDTFTAVGSGGAANFTASGTGNIADTVNLPAGASVVYSVTAQISTSATGTLSNTATAAIGTGEINLNSSSVGGVVSAIDNDAILPGSVDIEVTTSDIAGGSSAGYSRGFSDLAGYSVYHSILIAFGSILYGEAGSQIYSINADGSGFTLLASGLALSGNLAISSDGSTLYGTTTSGGTDDDGEIFSLSTGGGAPNILYSFTGGLDGADPMSGLTLSGNTLYGTTYTDGANGAGTVFSIHTDGSNFTTLAALDSASPEAELTISGSTIYGTDSAGSLGQIFSLSTSGGTINVLHSFNGEDGFDPQGTLLISGSVIYGTTGGGQGTVFRINTDGSDFSNLYSFGFSSLNGSIYEAVDGNLILSGSTLYGLATRYPNGPSYLYALSESGGSPNITLSQAFSIRSYDYGIAMIGATIYVATDSGLYATQPPTVTAGNSLTYTLTVSDNGPENASAVSIADLLGSNSAISSDTFTATASGGATGFTASGSGSINDTVTLPSGSSIVYTITAQLSSIDASGTLDNTATATVLAAGQVNVNPFAIGGVTSATDSDSISALGIFL
jgi:uncharacterized repeat protein (TIGR01451 family)